MPCKLSRPRTYAMGELIQGVCAAIDGGGVGAPACLALQELHHSFGHVCEPEQVRIRETYFLKGQIINVLRARRKIGGRSLDGVEEC